MEGVFVLLIVGVNGLTDLVGGSARRDQGRLQTRGPRLQRQHHLADVARDDDVDLVLVDRALEGANGIGRGGVIVVGDDFDLASVDAALGIDLVGGKLGGLRDRSAGDGLRFRNDADLDRIGGECRTGSRQHEAQGRRAKQRTQKRRSGCCYHDVSLRYLRPFRPCGYCSPACVPSKRNPSRLHRHGKNRLGWYDPGTFLERPKSSQPARFRGSVNGAAEGPEGPSRLRERFPC